MCSNGYVIVGEGGRVGGGVGPPGPLGLSLLGSPALGLLCETRENLKNSNFVKKGKTVIFQNSIGKKSGIFLDLG